MQAWTLVDCGRIPGDGGELQLHRLGEEWAISIEGHELMSSRASASEEALAELGCEPIADRIPARVLIGGLGMGFTLAAALRQLTADATVVVAELAPAVVTWNRELFGELAGRPLDDPRVSVHHGDVAECIRGETAGWDAILLDVDNGPEGMTVAANDRLYSRRGLEYVRQALRPAGVLAVWSAADDADFTRRLQRGGFRSRLHRVRARGTKGARHVIWTAIPDSAIVDPTSPTHGVVPRRRRRKNRSRR